MFNLYANITINTDAVPALRARFRDVQRALVAAGAWAEAARFKIEDLADSEDMRVIVTIGGPRLVDVDGARSLHVAAAEATIADGGQFWSLGLSHGLTDENLFDERPDLRANPKGEPVPDPVSVQLGKTRDALAQAQAAQLAAEQAAAVARTQATKLDERLTAAQNQKRIADERIADLERMLREERAKADPAPAEEA